MSPPAACTCPFNVLDGRHRYGCPARHVFKSPDAIALDDLATIVRDAKRRGFVLAIENAEAVRIYQERGEWPEELA